MGFVEKCTPVPTAFIWDPAMGEYFFGDHHPMHPSRLDVTSHLAESLGLYDLENITLEKPEAATDAQLQLVHSQEYIDRVKSVSADPDLVLTEYGLGTEDTPIFRGMHEASARLAGASYLAAELIANEKVLHAVNFAGGMHHASRNKASGFCIYNDCALAIQHLLDRGFSRVAYVDVDAHHGDGTQNIFWNDPRVLTISMHETGMKLFPGTGFSNETGPEGKASGTSVNIAIPETASDADWIRAFDAVIPAVLKEFSPEIIVSQHGCDSHQSDTMSHLGISIECQREIAAYMAVLAKELCQDRWIATGGGGYSIYEAVPRAWTHLMAIAAGYPLNINLPTPASWQKYVLEKYGVQAPVLMGDRAEVQWHTWEIGFNPEDATDRSVMATRKAIFPLWGLDPWLD
ncbi:acetoin utilization protein AcuC [uncultured Rothia sp.]|uniref:acetoin utilization protein AcuC n=1 Tax=uncultured Rothia sp. TaxID=316088 RepID=UPI0032173D90